MAPEEVAAIVVEPVIGEGGYIVPDGWLQALRELCDRPDPARRRRGPVGDGRTGTMWAVEHFGVETSSSRARGSRAACRREYIAKDSDDVDEGHAWVHVRGELALLRRRDRDLDAIAHEELLENAAKVGDLAMNGLRDIQSRHDAIREVRGSG